MIHSINTLSDTLNLALKAAHHAGEIVNSAPTNDIASTAKGNEGIVTEYDQRAEQTIRTILQAESDYAILGEEEGLAEADSEWMWVIDPIDGTTNFAHGIPFFVVSIGLMHKKTFHSGVILNPSTGDCYYAEQGKGAFKNGQSIQVSNTSDLGLSLVCTSSGYAQEHKDTQAEVMLRLGGKCGLRRFGATALEMCLVAEGVAEAFICPGDSLWDYAAATLILLEAGGRFTDWHDVDQAGETMYICASNGNVHAKLLAHLKDLQLYDVER
ncbi:MAG: inositol monophosphatase family protein [Chloroflexota bacterium]